MKLLQNLLLMFIDLYVRCMIIVWLIWLIATNTTLFDNSLIKFVSILVFFLWIFVFPVRRFKIYAIESKGESK